MRDPGNEVARIFDSLLGVWIKHDLQFDVKRMHHGKTTGPENTPRSIFQVSFVPQFQKRLEYKENNTKYSSLT